MFPQKMNTYFNSSVLKMKCILINAAFIIIHSVCIHIFWNILYILVYQLMVDIIVCFPMASSLVVTCFELSFYIKHMRKIGLSVFSRVKKDNEWKVGRISLLSVCKNFLSTVANRATYPEDKELSAQSWKIFISSGMNSYKVCSGRNFWVYWNTIQG